MLHAKFQDPRRFGSGEDFLKVKAIYSPGGHLGHVTWTISLIQRMLHMKFGFDWPRHFRGDV